MRSPPTPPARAMALDVGGRRIGVAIADETGAIATPIAVLQRGRGDLAELARLVREWGVDRLVVGLPTGLSGREGPQAADVRAYAQRLAETLGPEPPIEFWDERLTTAIAERALIATGARRAQRKAQIDAVAAAVILQGYLDAQRHRRARAAGHPT
jgi:putative Holliday junction resolvase